MAEMLSGPSLFPSAVATLKEKTDANNFRREREISNLKWRLYNGGISGFSLKEILNNNFSVTSSSYINTNAP